MSDQGDNSSEHSGDMEAELDSDQEQDLDKILGSWLGELESMTQNLDSGSGMDGLSVTSPPPMPSNNLDNFRFSLSALQDPSNSSLEDTQDVDLDALLGDLCKMEQSLHIKSDTADYGTQNSNSLPMFPSYSDLGKPQVAAPPAVAPKPRSPPSGAMSPPPPPPPPMGSGILGDQDLPPPPPPGDMMDGSGEPLPPPPDMMAPPPMFDPKPPPAQSAPLPPVAPKPSKSSPPVAPKPSSPERTTPPFSHFDTSPPPPVAPKPSSPERTQPLPHLDTRTAAPPLTLIINQPSSPPAMMSQLVSSPTGTHLGQDNGASSPLSQSVRVKLKDFETQLMSDNSLTEDEKQARLKAEKIKIALEKLKKARVQKLIVKVYTEDNSSKTIFVDETMSTRNVVHTLVEKNHCDEKLDYSVVEQLPDLYMERIVEDHEHLVTDVMVNWTRDTNNRLLFSERREKYALFRNPQNFLLSSNTSQAATDFAEKSKQALIDEFFSSFNQVPEIEGPLYLKTEGKKSWKKYYCLLRASGLYYSPKGKSRLSKDLVCLVQFEHYGVYHGVGWKKKYKSPTDHCFALKHPQIQQKSKYIKYMCAEDYRSCQRWITGIRIAKYGKSLLNNYNDTQREMSEYASSIESMSQSSLGDSSSISSMHSSASTQSTHSSQGSTGISPSGSMLVVPAAQQLSIQRNARTSSVGNMFSTAWKKGVEAQQTNKETFKAPSPTERDFQEESFKPSVMTPTLTKGNPQTFDSIDVQQSLMELEMEMDRDQTSTHRPDNQRNMSASNDANNLNNSNAVCVDNNIDPLITPTNGPLIKDLPPSTIYVDGDSGAQFSVAQNKRTTSIISTNKQRGVSPSRGDNGKRVQFKDDLEENIPIHSSETQLTHTPAKPILNNSIVQSMGYQPSYAPRSSHSFSQPHSTSRPVSFPNSEHSHYALPQANTHVRSHSLPGCQPMSPPTARCSSASPHNIQLIKAHPIPHAISHQVALGNPRQGTHGKPHSPGSPVMRINANSSPSQTSRNPLHSPVTLINANATSQRVGSPKAKHESPAMYHDIAQSLMAKSQHKPQAIVQPQAQSVTQAYHTNHYGAPIHQQSSPIQQSHQQSSQSYMYSPQSSSPHSSPYPGHSSPRSSPIEVVSPRSQHSGYVSNGSPMMSPPTQSRQNNSTFLAELNNALKPRPGVTINNNNLISKPPPSPRNRMTRQDIPYSQAPQQSPYNPGSQSPRQGHPPRVIYPVDGPSVPPSKSGYQSPPQSPGGVNAIRVLPQSPGVVLRSSGHPHAQVTRQTSNKGPKPPPPPRRTDSGSLAVGKKVPPPPPQRTT